MYMGNVFFELIESASQNAQSISQLVREREHEAKLQDGNQKISQIHLS